MSSIAPNPCVACSVAELLLFGRREGYTYAECSACGTIQLSPMGSWEHMRRAYEEEYGGAAHIQEGPENRDAALQHQFQAIADALKKEGVSQDVLDCGSGWGGLMAKLTAQDIQCEGIDVAQEVVDFCRGRNQQVHCGELSDLDGEARYNAILFSCVFEHLIEHGRVLDECHRLLRPGGLVVSLQPTALGPAWLAKIFRLGSRRRTLPKVHHTFCPPWHTVIFSIEGMKTIMARHGFDVVAIRIAPQQRDSGFTGIAQRLLERINAWGSKHYGLAWPAAMGHVYVFRKR